MERKPKHHKMLRIRKIKVHHENIYFGPYWVLDGQEDEPEIEMVQNRPTNPTAESNVTCTVTICNLLQLLDRQME